MIRMPCMEQNTTTETGHRGLWIIVGVLALVAVIALVYLTGGGGGGGGAGGY
jgi:uncharacterized membrane protein